MYSNYNKEQKNNISLRPTTFYEKGVLFGVNPDPDPEVSFKIFRGGILVFKCVGDYRRL